MDTTLLRLAKRDKHGIRSWTIPSYPNAVKLIPGRHTFWNVAALSWPWYDADRAQPGWVQRKVRLDWHRSIAKAGIREILTKLAK